MKKGLTFALVTAALFFLTGWLGIRAFPSIGIEGQQAVVMSGGIAFTVQMITYGILRFFEPTNVMAGFGMGMLVRFLVLVLHGFIGVPLLGLPMGAALLSLAAFLFVSTLVEPFFLARHGPPPSTTP